MKTWILNLLLVFSCSAQGALLELTANGKNVESVPTHSAAIETLSGSKISMASKGAGLRNKKIAFVKIKVYVAEYFQASGAQAMRLQFLRDVDAEKVMNSFKEALEANSVDLKNQDVQAFLNAVQQGGEAKEKTSMTILSVGSSAGETLSYESPSGKTTTLKVASGFGQKIFSIWLGKPADDGLADLQKSFQK